MYDLASTFLQYLDEFNHHGNRIGGGQRGEGVGLVGGGGAATGKVGEGTENDEREPLLVAYQCDGGALHLNGTHFEFVVEKVSIGSIVQVDIGCRPS